MNWKRTWMYLISGFTVGLFASVFTLSQKVAAQERDVLRVYLNDHIYIRNDTAFIKKPIIVTNDTGFTKGSLVQLLFDCGYAVRDSICGNRAISLHDSRDPLYRTLKPDSVHKWADTMITLYYPDSAITYPYDGTSVDMFWGASANDSRHILHQYRKLPARDSIDELVSISVDSFYSYNDYCTVQDVHRHTWRDTIRHRGQADVGDSLTHGSQH